MEKYVNTAMLRHWIRHVMYLLPSVISRNLITSRTRQRVERRVLRRSQPIVVIPTIFSSVICFSINRLNTFDRGCRRRRRRTYTPTICTNANVCSDDAITSKITNSIAVNTVRSLYVTSWPMPLNFAEIDCRPRVTAGYYVGYQRRGKICISMIVDFRAKPAWKIYLPRRYVRVMCRFSRNRYAIAFSIGIRYREIVTMVVQFVRICRVTFIFRH